jgi:choline-sulfatase
MVEVVDLLPTILGLLEVPVPPGLHGLDLSGLAKGEPGSRGRDVVCSEYQDNEEAMARSDRYKLIVGAGRRVRKDGYATGAPPPGPYERLYDERDDPGEMHDLAADPTLAEVKQELEEALFRRFVTTWNGPEPIPPGLSRLETIHWCLIPRDKPNPGPPGQM